MTLHRGLCPCCGEAFRADAPADMPPGSPFGPNLRAFVIYLRFMHAISFERLARNLSTTSRQNSMTTDRDARRSRRAAGCTAHLRSAPGQRTKPLAR